MSIRRRDDRRCRRQASPRVAPPSAGARRAVVGLCVVPCAFAFALGAALGWHAGSGADLEAQLEQRLRAALAVECLAADDLADMSATCPPAALAMRPL